MILEPYFFSSRCRNIHEAVVSVWNVSMMAKEQNPIIFNASKKELFNSNTGYRSMQKKLRAQYKIQRWDACVLVSCMWTETKGLKSFPTYFWQFQRRAAGGEADRGPAVDHCRTKRKVHSIGGDFSSFCGVWRFSVMVVLDLCCSVWGKELCFHFGLFLLQLEVLKQYLEGGGNMLVMLGEGGEMKYDTNINFLLEEFGILINNGSNPSLLQW